MASFGSLSQNPFETAWEQGKSVGRTVGKTVQQQSKQWSSMANGQVLGTLVSTDPRVDSSPQNAKDFQQELQGQKKPTQAASLSDPFGMQNHQQTQVKLADTRAKLQLLKQQHTATYFNPTFNSRKHEVAQQQEEQKKVQEQRVDFAKKEEEKRKKFNFNALTQSTHRTETFRGASG